MTNNDLYNIPSIFKKTDGDEPMKHINYISIWVNKFK